MLIEASEWLMAGEFEAGGEAGVEWSDGSVGLLPGDAYLYHRQSFLCGSEV